MTHASLFTGIGGFDLAASWIGWQNLFTCEIDHFCNTILEYYFQNSKHYEDIKKTDFKEWRGKVDVLTGGFPCQPFSIAGKRKGKTDDRYLWPEMLRAIREIQPTWIVGENVDGIISMVQPGSEFEVEHQFAMFEADHQETVLEQEYVVETICRDIECEEYSVQPIVIPACAVGAPHRRYRIWFIAHRNSHDAGRCGYEKLDARREKAKLKKNNMNGFAVSLNELAKKGLLPTPTNSICTIQDYIQSKYHSSKRPKYGEVLLNTPTANDAKNSTFPFSKMKRHGSLVSDLMKRGNTGQLNPLYVAEMMGFPVDWTVLPFQSGETNQSNHTETQ